MQVLGDLIRLPGSGDLPLPWWHRAPLGMMHKTNVFAALTEPGSRGCSDLLISAIDPAKWRATVRLDVQADDAAGVLNSVFSSVSNLNVALAEAATIYANNPERIHEATLFCEAERESDIGKVEEQYPTVGRWHRPRFPRYVWTQSVTVDWGWVRDPDWRAAMHDLKLRSDRDIDLSTAVVSADTRQRVLRYVFPRIGAFWLEVEHRDQPRTLVAITRAITECDVNVLSALIRRGGARHGNATLVAVCEPLKGKDASVGSEVRAALRDLAARKPDLRIDCSEPRSARECDEALLYPRHPSSVVAYPPKNLVAVIQARRRELGRNGLKPVFISCRFLNNELLDNARKTLETTLRLHGCEPVYARITPGHSPRSLDDVDATMWACVAAIVLVVRLPGKEDVISKNMTQEYGFMRGQGKPLLLLVDKEASDMVRESWSNSQGVASPYLEFKEFDHGSMPRIVSEWMLEWSKNGQELEGSSASILE
jgi:hypothetical protein